MTINAQTEQWQVSRVNAAARLDLPAPGPAAEKLHVITGRARKCGPSALSAVTGVPTHDAAAAIRAHNGGKPVNGTALTHFLLAMSDLGYVGKLDGSVYPGRLTMAGWLKTRPAPGLHVLWVGGYRRSHYVAVEVTPTAYGALSTRWADSACRTPRPCRPGRVPQARHFSARRRVVCAVHVRVAQ